MSDDRTPADEETPQEPTAGEEQEPAAAEQPAGEEQPAAEEPAAAPEPADEEQPAPRQKPEIPGADLEVDLVMEGAERGDSPYDEDDDGEPSGEDADDVADDQPIAAVTIDLAAGARYSATGKRKTAVARVILKPGTGAYTINGRTLDGLFPRTPLQRNIRQPPDAAGHRN